MPHGRRALYLSMLLLLVLVPTALASEVNSYQVSPHSKSTVVVNLNAGSASAVTMQPLGADFILTVIVLSDSSKASYRLGLSGGISSERKGFLHPEKAKEVK